MLRGPGAAGAGGLTHCRVSAAGRAIGLPPLRCAAARPVLVGVREVPQQRLALPRGRIGPAAPQSRGDGGIRLLHLMDSLQHPMMVQLGCSTGGPTAPSRTRHKQQVRITLSGGCLMVSKEKSVLQRPLRLFIIVDLPINTTDPPLPPRLFCVS